MRPVWFTKEGRYGRVLVGEVELHGGAYWASASLDASLVDTEWYLPEVVRQLTKKLQEAHNVVTGS